MRVITSYSIHYTKLYDCQAKVALATDDFIPFLTEAAKDLTIPFIGCLQDVKNLPDSEDDLQPKGPKELAYLQYTSGSTRFPRGVMITQRQVMSNLEGII